MSWSNVPDYMHPDDFHAVARACSGTAETVHFMHSMNWWAQPTLFAAVPRNPQCHASPPSL